MQIVTLTYNNASNRITTSGFTYDLAGNQTRIVQPDGGVKRFQYDAAGRLVKVKADNGDTIATHTYGASRERLITQNGDETSTSLTYYAWDGESVISEFVEGLSSNLVWSKNYVFMGGALLATHTKTDTGERTEFAHSDRLGTRLVSDPTAGTYFEQTTLPFGNALPSESSGFTNRLFTSYDRSVSTGLDYAINRFYDPAQGRFIQVDPIKMASTSLADPQTLNLYSYTANDPVNRVDPDGKFWGWITAGIAMLGRWIGGFFRNTNFNFNFNIRGLPISFGFQGHLRNIYLGIAGFNVQVTGRNSIFNLFKWRDDFIVTDFRSLVTEFNRMYGKKFRRCGWTIFSKDRDGNKKNFADIMIYPSSKSFPYEKVTLYNTISGAQAFFDGKTGEIGLRTRTQPIRLMSGTVVSAREVFFRNLAHEYANYLSWFYTSSARTFGVVGGIRGDADAGSGVGVASVKSDDDTGANMEKCIWNNVVY